MAGAPLRAKPLLLDAFCGAGGCSWGYVQAGFRVVGVDIVEQPNYPFDFVKADALAYITEHGHHFNVIHASPPCQHYTVLRKRHADKNYPDLVGPTRQALRRSGRLWVIENVPGAPLHNPVLLCGSAFAPYAIQRHRLFESPAALDGTPCRHERFTPRFPPNRSGRIRLAGVVSIVGHGAGKSGGFSAPLGRWAMGIDWMTKAEISQAIPPAYTRWIGKQLLEVL